MTWLCSFIFFTSAGASFEGALSLLSILNALGEPDFVKKGHLSKKQSSDWCSNLCTHKKELTETVKNDKHWLGYP